ncbi:MAG: NAD/NADP octopine/nopaline dehydrogenase family protein [Anaerolineaceae bacterium]|mgnify:CR=1 FL=1|nr:NAD/NADP octopine/nopaline dehydrogenase family protein [Anaerolineaceae bacterium]MDD4042608.1 NAD/NADP octopine/nopaline dehydrogenase family protein [Anaerolineaceae bacterium]MDD4577207.1 NAD/NADP octopine/nopaline dehydrogenase family protein [Anaerolineaceae bacterium]
MDKTYRYAVIGAGNGGKAMAAYLALLGVQVTMFNRTANRVEIIRLRGGIDLENPTEPRGFGELYKVTDNMEEALREADIVMVIVPSTAHSDIARISAPFLRDDHIVVLNPGRTGGALEFRHTLDQENCTCNPIISEAETFIFASRSEGPSQARIFRIKEAVPLAALPATRTAEVLDAIRPVLPQFIDGKNVLQTGLNNMGAIFHPALALLNAGWIEATSGDFEFYVDGVTPSVAKVLEVLDRERVTVASAIGLKARTALDWLELAYNATGNDLHEAMHNQTGYYGIRAPGTLNHRYITEEIPMSLVPIASFAKTYGVSVNGIESIINLANFIHGIDYRRRGRTVEKLGIKDLSVGELVKFVETGERD